MKMKNGPRKGGHASKISLCKSATDLMLFKKYFRGRSGSEAGERAPLQFDNPSYHTDDAVMGQEIAMSENEAPSLENNQQNNEDG